MIGAGHELGGYTIIKRIGGGGLGEVFLAQHRRVNRRAAVKVLLPELAQKASVLEQFFKEARNTSLIRHPGIVEILDCDLIDGQPFVITEFLEGESLGAYLARVGTLETDLAFLLGVMAAVAGAVEAAHRAGIMHRDLKPENIYLHLPHPGEPAVTVKVLDFGIAKLSREDGGPSQTKTGLWLATPTYMSPEQCRGVGRPDAPSDVYALGCVFYQALCGKPPFQSPSIADLILAHLTLPPKPPIKQLPDLPPKVNALILRMLAKKPEERPQSMEQVATTLRECARALGIDVEGQLLPLTPVERPTALLGAALAGVAPKPSAQAPLPVAPLPVAPLRESALRDSPLPQASAQLPVAPTPSPPPVAGPLFSAQASVAPAVSAERPARAVAPTQVASERGGQPAGPVTGPQAAVPAGRAFPRTLIAGVAERQAVAEGRLPATPGPKDSEPRKAAGGDARGEARIEALVGGTMVLEPERPVRPAPAAAGPIRAQIGGTRIMDQAAAPEDDDQPVQPDEEEDAAAPATVVPHARPGGEHTMRVAVEGGWMARVVPLLTGRAGLVALGVAALVALVIVMVRLLAGGTPSSAGRKPVPVAPPVAVDVTPALPVPPPPAEPPAPARPATVSIDIQGLSSDTQVLVDDQVVTLPTRVPRGPELHRFTLRPAHGAERTIEIDGTRDRVVELVMAPEAKAGHSPAPRPPRATPPVAPGAPRPGARPRQGLGPDRRAITDL